MSSPADRPPPEGASTEYGRIPLPVFLQLWNRSDVTRYRYRPIRLVPGLIVVVLLSLWGFYLYTVLGGAGMTLPLGLFGVGLVAFSVWMALRLMIWRLFVRRSGVVVAPEALAWRQGPLCFLAPWELIEPEGLGLDRIAFQGGYDSFLGIQVGDTAEPLYLVRVYAKLEDIEGLMGELLKRIPRDKWERAAKKARKREKKKGR